MRFWGGREVFSHSLSANNDSHFTVFLALQIYPVQSNIIIDKNYCPISNEEQHQAGVPDADLVIFLAANIKLICEKGALAAARSCQADQYDRPIAGSAVICLDEIDLNNDDMTDIYFRVMSHELVHVLGMRKWLRVVCRITSGH